MDPYTSVTLGEQRFKTRVKEDMGKEPFWNEIFWFDVNTYEDSIKVQVLNENTFRDSVLGEIDINLSTLCVESLDQWFKLINEGKDGG